MKKLEDFKSDLFAKELSKGELKLVKGSFALAVATGTRCTGTYSGKEYCGQDCDDKDGVD